MREFARIDSLDADGSVPVGAGVTYGELGRHVALVERHHRAVKVRVPAGR
jgi:hypothetical protein